MINRSLDAYKTAKSRKKTKIDLLYFAAWYLGNVQSDSRGELSNDISNGHTRWPVVRGHLHPYSDLTPFLFPGARVAVVKNVQRIRNLEEIPYNNHY